MEPQQSNEDTARKSLAQLVRKKQYSRMLYDYLFEQVSFLSPIDEEKDYGTFMKQWEAVEAKIDEAIEGNLTYKEWRLFVDNWLYPYKPPKKALEPMEIRRGKIAELYGQGKNLREIGVELNISHIAVRKHLVKMKLPLPKRGIQATGNE